MSDGPRRTWAPFVGAALAALTAGSLVVFALVAQRTSLDGFPELRIATPADAATGRPASITVAPIDGNADATREVASSDDVDSTEVAALTQPLAPPLTLIPLVPATTPSAPLDLASLDSPVGSPVTASGSRRPQRDDALTFDGRFRADGELLAARRDGGSSSDSAQAGDSRHGGKHAHKSHDAKSKKNKKSKNKKQKKSNHGAIHRRSRGRAHSHGPQGSSHSAAASASRSSGSQSNSHQSAAPRPAPSPQGPPAHSNAGGNGKSNGKGHKKH